MLLDIGINLIVTLCIYLSVPLIFFGFVGKVHTKKATQIAIFNSIFGCVVACLIRAFATGGEIIFSSFLPAVFYFYLARWILTDKNTKEYSLKNSRVKDIGTFALTKNDDSSDSSEKFTEPKTMDLISTKVKSVNSNRGLIPKLQKSVMWLILTILLFSIIYPICIIVCADQEVGDAEDRDSVKLSEIYSGYKVYCLDGYTGLDGYRINYLYVINEYGDVFRYEFKNKNRYSNNGGEYKGFATLGDLKDYFGKNLKLGMPKPRDIYGFAIPVGVTIPSILITAIIIICVIVHRIATEDIYELFKTDENLKKLREEFKDDQIPKSYYNRVRRIFYSKNILNENKFYSLFRFLY